MAELVNSEETTIENQIHITGIVIACPIGGEYSATVNFKKAKIVDGDRVIGYEHLSPEEGNSQLNLTQTDIIDLLGVETLENIKGSLHDKRKQTII